MRSVYNSPELRKYEKNSISFYCFAILWCFWLWYLIILNKINYTFLRMKF